MLGFVIVAIVAAFVVMLVISLAASEKSNNQRVKMSKKGEEILLLYKKYVSPKLFQEADQYCHDFKQQFSSLNFEQYFFQKYNVDPYVSSKYWTKFSDEDA
jgi:ABC-type microcin C transport system permease subunit YejE